MLPTSWPEEIQQFVNAEVASGHYPAAEDVIVDALRCLRDVRQQREEFATRLALSIEQANRGEAKPLDIDALMQRVEARLARDGKTG